MIPHEESGAVFVTALPASLPRIPRTGATTTRQGPYSVAQRLSVTVRPAPPGAVVLVVRGEVDMATSEFLQGAVLPYLLDATPLVTLDLTGVSFLGAAGLTVLVNARQAAVAAGSDLRLVATTRVVLLPLRIAGLDGDFHVHPELTDVPSFPGAGRDGWY